MENIWIWVFALGIIVMSCFYVGLKAEFKRGPKAILRTLTETFLGIVASFFFGSFGFRWDLFMEKQKSMNSAKKD